MSSKLEASISSQTGDLEDYFPCECINVCATFFPVNLRNNMQYRTPQTEINWLRNFTRP